MKFTEILRKIKSRQLEEVQQLLKEMHPNDLANLIDKLPTEEEVMVFRLLSHELARNTFQYLSLKKQKSLIEALGESESDLARLLNDLDPDDRTALFEELPESLTNRLLNTLSSEERKIAQELLAYPEESIGRLMTPDFVAVRPEFTI